MASGCHDLFQSANGGKTWQHIRFPFCFPSLIAADRASDIWVVCTSGPGAGAEWKAVYRSPNAGKTWQLEGRTPAAFAGRGPSMGNLSVDGYVYILVATSAEHAVLLSHRSGVSATFDGGRLWTYPSNAESLTEGPIAAGVACVGSEDCWAAAGDVVLRTINGGRSWTSARLG
jgi:hypothetical protein